MRHITVAAAVIVNGRDEILICRRPGSGEGADLWEFPGGKAEPGELLEDCVVRECKEELGAEIRVTGVYDTASFTYPFGQVDLTFFTAKLVQEEITCRVHQALKWVKRDELGQYAFWPANAEVVRKLAKGQKDGVLEKMDTFFAARAQGYDAHMLNEVEGCKEGYEKMASFVPSAATSLLDLGCGTGLELDEIFRIFPNIRVTGIDLTQEMLDILKQKHPGKDMHLICGDYFTYSFGKGFDCAVSFQTMHHFKKDKKEKLYEKIRRALVSGGVYIECDYMLESQQEEDFYFSEYDRLIKAQSLPRNVFYHYDTPCTVENQIVLLKDAGFVAVNKVWRQNNTTIIVAQT